MKTRRKLPIGIQSLRKLREEGCYYVDKTPFVAELAAEGGYYFLSRPRRFGKSLLVDTLAEAFSGNRELFAGLFLEGHWDWGRRYPVIRLSFAKGPFGSVSDLEHRIRRELAANAERLGISLPDEPYVVDGLDALIAAACRQYGERAVVLVDEYDRPILDNLTAPEVAFQMREGLRNLYSVLKARDADLRFVFLTGVSKFSKVSIFSGLNNLRDITLSAEYATICGYTERDLDEVFAPELEGLDREEIRRWYNGYRWGKEPVYNPFDVLLLLKERAFRPWWFETGTPRFLVEWLKARGYFTPQLEETFADDALLSAFDVDQIEPEAMLWQTGYLTIAEADASGGWMEYRLRVPNHEVRTALNRALLAAWLPDGAWRSGLRRELGRALAEGRSEAVHEHFVRLFASIPHDWYRNNPIAQYEGYYASVFYSHLAALGLEVVAEDVTSTGCCDLTIRHASAVWVFEFKVIEGDAPTGEALAQLKARDYAAKYRAPGVQVLEVGVEFSKTQRQIVGWEVG